MVRCAQAKIREEISRDIIQKQLIKRDLVITGSMIQTAAAQSDTDLYFIYKAGPGPTLPPKLQKDNRFVSLRDPDNESILLDAVKSADLISVHLRLSSA